MDKDQDEQKKLIADLSNEIHRMNEKEFLKKQEGRSLRGFFGSFFQVAGDDVDSQSAADVKKSQETAAADAEKLKHASPSADKFGGDFKPSAADYINAESIAAAATAGVSGKATTIDHKHSTTFTDGTGNFSRTRAKATADIPNLKQPIRSAATASTAAPDVMSSQAVKEEAGAGATSATSGTADANSGESKFRQRLKAYRLKRRHRIPISQRWWFPWACLFGICLIWTPDKYKVNTLLWLDEQHEDFKSIVHLQYWRLIMPRAEFLLLQEQLRKNVPKSMRVPTSDCPL